MKKLFGWYFNSSLLLRIMVGLILGAACGIFFGSSMSWVQPFGEIFIRLLKMIVMPVIILTLTIGAASIHPSKLGRVGAKAFALYTITTAFAISLGLIFGNIFKPGKGMELQAADAAAQKMEITTPSLLDTFINIIPTNPFEVIVAGNILPVIFFCLLFGIGLAYVRNSEKVEVKDAGETLFSIFNAGAEVIYLVVHWILQYAPIGVFALIAEVFGNQGAEAFGPLAMITFAIYAGFLTHMTLVYGSILAFAKINPFLFFSKAKETTITGFVTRSSGGTLPVSIDIAENKMGIAQGVYSFSLPLGATINMDGTAIYQGVSAIFVGFAIGAPLSFDSQLTVIATAVLASIGTAGVPGAGAIMLMMVLNSIGLKVEPGTTVAAAYAMIFGIDALLDMGRTACNVTGDLAVTCVVAKSEDAMDPTYWDKN